MKIVENKDFKKEFPSSVTEIMTDTICFMNYEVVIQFKEEEWEEAWALLKKLNKGGDQIARDEEFIYIGY